MERGAGATRLGLRPFHTGVGERIDPPYLVSSLMEGPNWPGGSPLSIRSVLAVLAVLTALGVPSARGQTPDSTAVDGPDSAADPAPGAEALAAPHGWQEAWRIDLSRGVGTPAVWVDSLLLVASLDRNVHLVAPGVDRAQVVWDDNYRGGFEATPLVTGDRIYLPETRRGRRLVALDRRSRSVLWTANAGDLAAGPIARGETVLTVSTEGEVSAWGPNGTRLWRTELETRVVAAPVLLGDALVVAAADGALHALDAAGGEVLESVDPGAGKIWGDPVPVPGRPDAALFVTLDGQLLAVEGDLSISDRRSFPSAFYAGATPGEDGWIYLIGHEGTAWAYDWEAAEVAWTEELQGVFRAGATVGRGVVAFGDLSGTLYLLDIADGSLIWHTRLDGAITAAPTARGADLFVATEQGSLYLFRPTG